MNIPRWHQVMHGSIETDIKQFFEIDKITQTTGHTWRLRSIVPRLDSKFCFLFIQGHKCLESISRDNRLISVNKNFRARLAGIIR